MKDDQRWVHGERVPDDYRRGRGERHPGWERGILEKIATESIKEQRRGRRWGIFFKLLGFSYVGIALFLAYGNGVFSSAFPDGEMHTAVVDVNGTIAAGKEASAIRIIAGVKAAFEHENTCLLYTSPSPRDRG